jgi:uncharacterized protein (DUF697 family)
MVATMERNDPGITARANEIIEQHILWSVGAGLLPVPILDIAAVSGIQLDMLKQLSRTYGVSYTDSEGKAWLSALTGGLAAKIAANAIKLIPGFGSVIGGVSMAVLSGASTYALGKVAISHFQTSGTLAGVNFDSLKAVYAEELEKGKAVAEKVATQKQAPAPTVYDELERAKALHDKGVISEDDFEAIKAKLLSKI